MLRLVLCAVVGALMMCGVPVKAATVTITPTVANAMLFGISDPGTLDISVQFFDVVATTYQPGGPDIRYAPRLEFIAAQGNDPPPFCDLFLCSFHGGFQNNSYTASLQATASSAATAFIYQFNVPTNVAGVRLLSADLQTAGITSYSFAVTFDGPTVQPIPLPATLPMFAIGAALVGIIGRCRRANKHHHSWQPPIAG